MNFLTQLDPHGVKNFTKKINIVKESYHGMTYEGNECEKILRNIPLLKNTLTKSEAVQKTIDTLIGFQEFQEACCGVTPKIHFRFTIENFRNDFLTLHEKFGISITNKVHIIIDHVEDYISESGKGLGRVTDQTVEALHSALNKRLTSSNYWIKDIGSEKHGHKLYRGILHFNSYNL